MASEAASVEVKGEGAAPAGSPPPTMHWADAAALGWGGGRGDEGMEKRHRQGPLP